MLTESWRGCPCTPGAPVRQEFAASPIVDLEAALAAGGLAGMVRPGQRNRRVNASRDAVKPEFELPPRVSP